MRGEDKDAIAAFHWRGAPDEAAAEAAVREIAAQAEQEGFAVHWGRKVLEVRPPVRARQGPRHRRAAARRRPATPRVYVGDDTTDLDAFRGLRELVRARARCDARCASASRSDEAPAELAREADLTVDGPGGVRGLLEALL